MLEKLQEWPEDTPTFPQNSCKSLCFQVFPGVHFKQATLKFPLRPVLIFPIQNCVVKHKDAF